MALMIVTTVLLLCCEPAVALWINYTSINILPFMSTYTEENAASFESCFANCTNVGPPADSGTYYSKLKMCYCGPLRGRNNPYFPYVNLDLTAFILENGFDCSCSERILKNTDGMITSITATDIDECENLCFKYDKMVNVVTFYETSVGFSFPFVCILKRIV
uniref:WSC domain-containing protein n=1 Tax=Mesocestoides corti TaxID=53468 RepID=A0A5K3FIE5_MESCO